MKFTIAAVASAITLLAAPVMSEQRENQPGFLQWIEGDIAGKGCEDIMCWMRGKSYGNTPQIAIKSVKRVRDNENRERNKHAFMELESDVEFDVRVVAFLKPRHGDVQSSVPDELMQQVSMIFNEPMAAIDGMLQAHRVSFVQSYTIPKGQVGLFIDPFANFDHPDCNDGIACQVTNDEVLELITIVENVNGCALDDPYTNMSRLTDGTLVRRPAY